MYQSERSETLDLTELASQDVRVLAAPMERDAVMRHVAGPLITGILRPIYEQPFSPKELRAIPRLALEQQFPSAVQKIAVDRLHDRAEEDSEWPEFMQFDRLHKRNGLFFAQSALDVLKEGITSGVAVPLTVASHIDELENPNNYGESGAKRIATIMRRKTFDEILQHLTKGPNGFLGKMSLTTNMFTDEFFDFWDPKESTNTMTIFAAYDQEDGEVVGLSGSYHEAANLKRREKREGAENAHNTSKHIGHVSSGCPVRHRFENAGELQEPLIVTAKNFLIRALEVGVDKQVAQRQLATP